MQVINLDISITNISRLITYNERNNDQHNAEYGITYTLLTLYNTILYYTILCSICI